MMKTAIFAILILLFVSCSENKKPESIAVSPFQDNINTKWKLVSPDPGLSCELSLHFLESGRLNLNFKGKDHVGMYEIDSELSNYIKIKLFEKEGWDNRCPVNPDYLSFYDVDTEFSWSRVDSRLYFQRSGKVMQFEKVL